DRTAELRFICRVVADDNLLSGHRQQGSRDHDRADQLVERRELRAGPEVGDPVDVREDLQLDSQLPAKARGVIWRALPNEDEPRSGRCEAAPRTIELDRVRTTERTAELPQPDDDGRPISPQVA